MNKFILNILYFVFVLLIVIIGIECLLLFQTNIYSYKRNYVENHINDIKVILLGNSHVDQNLNPQWIGDSVFNFAIQGRDKKYDVALAKKYIPQMKNLKVVIMPLDYFDFHFGREVKEIKEDVNAGKDKYSSTYKCMYYKYMGIHLDGWWYWPEIFNSRLNYMNRFFMTAKEARECDSLGFVRYGIEKRRQGWKYERLPVQIDISKERNIEMYKHLFMNYMTIAQMSLNQGARFVLLATPVYKTYQKGMNQSIIIEIDDFVKKLKRVCPNVEYYDFTCNKSFFDEDFYDASHLSDSGAKKFSTLVSEIVQN